jgi:hypothetical protein
MSGVRLWVWNTVVKEVAAGRQGFAQMAASHTDSLGIEWVVQILV